MCPETHCFPSLFILLLNNFYLVQSLIKNKRLFQLTNCCLNRTGQIQFILELEVHQSLPYSYTTMAIQTNEI